MVSVWALADSLAVQPGAMDGRGDEFPAAANGSSFSFLERKGRGLFGGPKTGSAADEVKLAGELKAAGRLSSAARRYNAAVRCWGTSEEAPLAQMAYADILLELGKEEDAFKEYQYLVKFYSGQFDYDHVLDCQFKIADYLMKTPRGKFLFFPGFEAPERALPYFRQILENGPTWRLAPQVQFNIGLIKEGAGRMEEAVAAYDAVMSRFRGHELASEAAFRKAVCLMDISRESPRNEVALRDALSAMATFIAVFPGSRSQDQAQLYLDDMNERLVKMHFSRAEFYDKIGRNEKAAIIAYSEFIRQFPLSKLAVEAQDRIDSLKKRDRTPE